MEALTWRANNVLVSYGAIRGEAGGACGTQEKESVKGDFGKSSIDKTRLGGEKTPGGAATGGNRGRRFTLAPLSAKNFFPLRFLWFPDNSTRKNEQIPRGEAGSGSSVVRDPKIQGVYHLLDDQREKEVIPGSGENCGGDVSDGRLDPPRDSPRDLAPAGPGEVVEGEFGRKGSMPEGFDEGLGGREKGNVGKKWFQNILRINFLNKNPKIDVPLPPSELLPNPSASASMTGNLVRHISSTDGDLRVQNLDEAASSASAENKVVDTGNHCESEGCECAGCVSEGADDGSVDPALGLLAALEVPHVNVTHDYESFSKFLAEVPLTEMKIIAQASILCKLAYVIPEIKAGELARYYRMLFVTSSINVKNENLAREKAEAEEVSRQKAAAAAKLEADRKEAASTSKGESHLSPTKAYALTAAAVSFLRSRKEESSVQEGRTTISDDLGPASTQQNQATNLPNIDPIAMLNAAEIPSSESDLPEAFIGPVTSVVSAEKETKQKVANNLRSLHSCPCEWFACDEKGGPTRFFSIQGSDSFASWQANLLFEPVQFETKELGVMVHRGIYEAAKGLYEQVLPQVLEHQKKFGERARYQFTGHSLGGSLAVLLTLMLNIRGVLKADTLLPVYTFGAPYVMCGGDYLLKKLGFPLSHVQYIVMHRDIVPRSFSCNYPDHVAEVLKRVNGTFRDHTCLTQQKLLYAPMGQLVVLQPDQQVAVPHPFLPSGSGLYVIGHQSHNEPSAPNDTDITVASRAVQLRAAQRAFLNKPHPLEIMSDPGAYGSDGSISRNHDPRNYVKAINGVLRQEMRRFRRLHRERRRQLWWPLINSSSAIVASKGTGLGGQMDHGAAKGVASRGICGPSGPDHFGSDLAAGRAPFPVRATVDHRGRFSRYKSLIASQHVQMGLVVFLTARMFIQEGFAVVLAWI